MPRHRRLEIAGGIYHVIVRGIERRVIFNDDADHKEFIRRFAEGLKRTGSQCLGWVLMPNHFHLLIRTGIRPLSEVMRGLLTGYAQYFNRRNKRAGYLYQNRYKSILCQEDIYLRELVRYVHLNPLRGRIVKDIEGLNGYAWGGHSVLLGKTKADWQSTDEVLEIFGEKKNDAIKKYLAFIEEGKEAGRRDDLTGGGLVRSAGGWKGLMELRRGKERWRGDDRVLGDGGFVSSVLKMSEEEIERKEKHKRAGWDIKKLVEKVCNELKIKPEQLKNKGRNNTIAEAKKIIAYLGNRELGLSGSEIAKHLKISKQAVSKAMRDGERVNGRYGVKLSN